jgi:hypothetical protein
MKQTKLTHKFVELIPTEMEDGVLYVSMEYATAIHRCACGCGREVVTAISPTDWSFLFDGESVTLDPSIGNWNFPCRSHYFIRRGQVRWAGEMSQHDIERGRQRDRKNKNDYFETGKASGSAFPEKPAAQPAERSLVPVPAVPPKSTWQRVVEWLTR